jgi:hypothetical protein
MSDYEDAENSVRRFAEEVKMDVDAFLSLAHAYARSFQGPYHTGLYNFPKWFEGNLDEAAD